MRAFLEKYRQQRLRKSFPTLTQAFQITSHLTMDEKCRLYLLAKNREYMLEIGSYTGASACCFGAASKEAGSGKIVCVDTWNNDAMSEGNRDTWQEFQRNTKGYKAHIIPIRGFSTEVVDDVTAQFNSFDLLFIDGDHSYEGVKADWDAYKKFLRSGSVVIFHDTGWADGVRRVVDEEAVPLVRSSGSLPNMWWGFIR